jgi:HK97 family phage major capsid protein
MFNKNVLRARRAELLESKITIAKGGPLAGPNATVVLEDIDREIKEVDSKLARHADLVASEGFHDRPMLGPNPDAHWPEDGPRGATGRREGLGRSITEALRHAGTEVREEVGEFVAYLQGRISASADLNPSSGGGGVPMPAFVQATMERNFSAFSPVADNCRVLATDTGNDLTVPVLSDSETAVQLASSASTGADATVSGDTPPTALTGPKLSAYKLSSKPVFVPRETITDAGGDIIGDVLASLVARIVRKENSLYTNGSGSGEAQGVTKGATALLEASQLSLDVLLDLAYSCSALYRPNGIYMMSDATAKYVRKLRTGISGDLRVLWSDANFQTGQPARLHGYPVAINNDLPDVSGSGYISGHEVIFGDFSKFLVRRAENGRVFVYRYPVESKDGQGLICFRRSDSRLLVPEAIVKLSVGGS